MVGPPVGGRREDEGAAAGGQGPAGDYLVPWHLPFNRAGGAPAAAAAAKAAPHPGEGGDAQRQLAGAGGAAAAPGAARLDAAKGAVVFQRYYHLFERGELEALVARVPGATLVDSFYDRSNWCAVFERAAAV
jgi:alkylated DNA repair protein alkB family protein 8